MTGRELDRSVWQQLRTLSKENAEGVAQHLVMVSVLLEADDIDGAMAHAETATRRAGRVPAAREALGMVAYRAGDFARALSEFRTVRRLSGSSHLLPLMVDCERGLGRPERALELAQSKEADTLKAEERVELIIVTSGIRRDLGQLEAALLTLDIPALHGPVRPWSARLFYAYADTLLELGRVEEAREWFAKAAEHDTELQTDASERLDEIDGISIDFDLSAEPVTGMAEHVIGSRDAAVDDEPELDDAADLDDLALDTQDSTRSGADLVDEDLVDEDLEDEDLEDEDLLEGEDLDDAGLEPVDLDDVEAEVDALLEGTIEPGDPLSGRRPERGEE